METLASLSSLTFIASSPTIDKEGTIYVAVNEMDPSNTSDEVQGYVYAFYKNGGVKWQVPLRSGDVIDECTPTVGKDGTIFVASGSGYVYAIRPNGTALWSRQYGSSIRTSIVIGTNNNLYFAAFASGSSRIFCVNPANGDEVWSSAAFGGEINDSIALDSAQNAYFVYFSTSGGQFVFLVSIDSLGQTRYTVDLNQTLPEVSVGNLIGSRPMLSSDQSKVFVLTRVYIQSGGSGYYYYLHCIGTADHTYVYPAMQFEVSNFTRNDSLARDLADRVYFTGSDADGNGVLYGVQHDGAVVSTYTIPKVAGAGNYTVAAGSPVVASDGTVYFAVVVATNNGDLQTSSVYAVTSTGTLKWIMDVPDDATTEFNSIDGSLSLNNEGDVVVSSNFSDLAETLNFSKLFVIKA